MSNNRQNSFQLGNKSFHEVPAVQVVQPLRSVQDVQFAPQLSDHSRSRFNSSKVPRKINLRDGQTMIGRIFLRSPSTPSPHLRSSRARENGRSDERLGAGARIVRIDRE